MVTQTLTIAWGIWCHV